MDHVKGPQGKYICIKRTRNPTTGLAGGCWNKLASRPIPAGPECKDDFARKFELILLLGPRKPTGKGVGERREVKLWNSESLLLSHPV